MARRGRKKQPFKLKLKKTTLYTLSSVSLFSLAGLVVLSFSRQGIFLARLYYLLIYYFSWGVILLPLILVSGGLILSRLHWRVGQPNVLLGVILLLVSTISLTHSGLIGNEIWQSLALFISGVGAFLVLLGFVFVSLVITFNTSLEEIILFINRGLDKLQKAAVTLGRIGQRSRLVLSKSQAGRQAIEVKGMSGQKVSGVKGEMGDKEGTQTADESLRGELVSNLPGQDQVWKYPLISLLSDDVSGKADRGDIKKNAEVIEKTLESFGITAQVAEVNLGPAVTQYALEIALGTKLSKITALSNDLALALAAPTGQIRIEAPIPGRSLVGVEVPNRSPEFVGLKQMLTADSLKKTKSKLAIGLGLDVSGQPVISDISKMPHILIAGATGSGKSVCINSFITTILYRASPAEVKFILVDPKRVELTQYDGIPHLLTPVIIDPEKVLSALRWAASEMERRYKLFAEVGVRNIEGYNELSGFAALPYILIIIDELADIILFSPAEVEDTICRIAQMARAVGIHLLVSTQRPSVDIITGLIKANIPCRIAFNVSSQVDSRVIIDTPGAEKLLGRGDMLYIPPDQAKPTRIQGTLVTEPEIRKLIDFLKKTGVAPVYTEEVTRAPVSKAAMSGGESGEEDELFEDAVRTICNYDRASASLLQRRLRVGYARAARILDQLERAGIVGPAEGSKPREVLVSQAEEYLASQIANKE